MVDGSSEGVHRRARALVRGALERRRHAPGGVRRAAARRPVERASAAGAGGRMVPEGDAAARGSTRGRRTRVPRAREGQGQRQRRGDDAARDVGPGHRHTLRRPRSAGVRVDVPGHGEHRPGPSRRRHVADRRGHGRGDRGRAHAARDRHRLLLHDRRVHGPRGLPTRRRVDRGHDAMVRASGDQRVPGPLPRAARRDHAPAGGVRRRRGAGTNRRRRADGLRRGADRRGGVPRDRRDPAEDR